MNPYPFLELYHFIFPFIFFPQTKLRNYSLLIKLVLGIILFDNRLSVALLLADNDDLILIQSLP